MKSIGAAPAGDPCGSAPGLPGRRVNVPRPPSYQALPCQHNTRGALPRACRAARLLCRPLDLRPDTAMRCRREDPCDPATGLPSQHGYAPHDLPSVLTLPCRREDPCDPATGLPSQHGYVPRPPARPSTAVPAWRPVWPGYGPAGPTRLRPTTSGPTKHCLAGVKTSVARLRACRASTVTSHDLRPDHTLPCRCGSPLCCPGYWPADTASTVLTFPPPARPVNAVPVWIPTRPGSGLL